MTLCLNGFINGYKGLMMDYFGGNNNNFLNNFINSQPTTQKAKHVYESYSHLHNITTKIPPKYSALLQEKSLESDRNWRRLIRASYEIVHQILDLCLVSFYNLIHCNITKRHVFMDFSIKLNGVIIKIIAMV